MSNHNERTAFPVASNLAEKNHQESMRAITKPSIARHDNMPTPIPGLSDNKNHNRRVGDLKSPESDADMMDVIVELIDSHIEQMMAHIDPPATTPKCKTDWNKHPE